MAEAIFGKAEASFGTAEFLFCLFFGMAEAIFGTAEARFGMAKAGRHRICVGRQADSFSAPLLQRATALSDIALKWR
jgi:hypothetical protein